MGLSFSWASFTAAKNDSRQGISRKPCSWAFGRMASRQWLNVWSLSSGADATKTAKLKKAPIINTSPYRDYEIDRLVPDRSEAVLVAATMVAISRS
jgi:hypothetical protein